MSYPADPPPQQLTPDDSDYGSDFTPEQEALVDELFAKIATKSASVAPTTSPPPLSQPPSQLSRNFATDVAAAISIATQNTIGTQDIEDYYAPHSSPRIPRGLGREKPGTTWQLYKPAGGPWSKATGAGTGAGSGSGLPAQNSGNGGAESVEHPNSTEGRARNRERDVAREQEWVAAMNPAAAGAGTGIGTTGDNPATDTTRTPIERFRRPPNKAFSVSDLISPAWCELQYWYTLTKYGRKRRTAAMKQGTTIHKTLEDEVHTTVSVEVATKEDALALRIWNIIQGLCTLREFGMTRELEVWGLVDGELVNGVIDQLSYECPDPELEASAASYYVDVEATRAALPEYQMSLTDYLLSSSQRGKRLDELSWDQNEEVEWSASSPPAPPPEAFEVPRVYMTDIKTKGSGSIPTVKSTSFRPTALQLQIYYHMLNRLVTSDDVTIESLAARYNLDPNRPFTDAFVAGVGGLNDQFFDAMSSQEFDPDFIPTPEDALKKPPSSPSSSTIPPSGSQDSTTILIENNNLTNLWRLMKDRLRLTFLPSQETEISMAPSIPSENQPSILESYPTVLSPLLTARYLSASESRSLGSRSFLYDPISMTSYLSEQMSWWKGQRDPRGVEVMEAWKCRICEFRDECSWRQEKAWALANRNRGRKKAAA